MGFAYAAKGHEPRQGKCNYENGGRYACSRPCEPHEPFCLAHRSRRTPQEESKFIGMVKTMLSEQTYEFTGFHFPEKFSFQGRRFNDTVTFKECHFAGDATFTGAVFEGDLILIGARISRDARLEGTEVHGHLNGRGLNVGRYTLLRGSTVTGDLCLAEASLGQGVVLESVMVGKSLDLNDADVGKDVKLGVLHVDYAGHPLKDQPIAEIAGDLMLSGARIKGSVLAHAVRIGNRLDLWQARIDGSVNLEAAEVRGSAHLEEAIIRGNLSFSGARIHNDVSLHMVRLDGSLDLTDTHFEADVGAGCAKLGNAVELRNTVFSRGIDLDAVSFLGAGFFKPFSIPDGQGASLCRFAKQTCQRMGSYGEAGKWHYDEMWHVWFARRQRSTLVTYRWLRRARVPKCIAGHMSQLMGWFRGLPEQLLRWVFGYGERPLNVALAAAVVICLCWVCYIASPQLLENSAKPGTRMTWWEGLYFSVVTFTTLGLGDWHPVSNSWASMVCMAEALLGALLMAMFVVALARRWGRG